MELNVSGLVSGFDWKSMVDQLSDVERAPQRRMRVEQNTIYKKNSAYTSLKSQLTSIKTTSETLKDTDLYGPRLQMQALLLEIIGLRFIRWQRQPSNWGPQMWGRQ